MALKIDGKLRQVDTLGFPRWWKRASDLETGDLCSSAAPPHTPRPPFGQLATLGDSFNLSDPQFPPLQTAGNNAHLAGLLGGLSGINYVEEFGIMPGTKQAEQLA